MLNRIAVPRGKRPRGPAPPREPWQRVPSVNLLTRPRRQLSTATMVQAALVVGVLVLAFAAVSAYQSWSDARDDRDATRVRLANVRRDLTVQQTAVNDLQSQVDALKVARQAAEQPRSALTAARIDWPRALSTLVGIDAPGIALSSVRTSPDGAMTVRGTAATVPDVVRYQGELRRRATVFDLISIRFTTAQADEEKPEAGVEFTASLSVVRGAAGG